MPLVAGTRIGAYEIVAPLGAGGMGEVYRARDLKLGRDVALKILPDIFANDADRRARFEREAQVLASLNHPHIGAIYGFEEAPSSGGQVPIRALALEFVDGPTLAERIAQGTLPLSEALPIALQIIDALDTAHAQGIVHRDLKPANIKLRPDGTVKVLDFGLAKSFDRPWSDQAQSPTITALSRSGVIVGTAAYMSPEQARGKQVDKRADIWAFGCVLFEMLTGASPFSGETTTDTLSAIVSREPDWSRLPASTPPALRTLLSRTLAKDPKSRLRDIGDVGLELRDPATRETAPVGGRRSTTVGWQIATAAAILIALAAGVTAWRESGTSAPPERRPTLTRITNDGGLTTEPTISADGRIIAYSSDRGGAGNLDIYVQQTVGGGAVRLTTDPTDESQPNISRDGTRITFRSERSGAPGVYVSPALGGDARLIAPQGRAPKFSPDGRLIAYWTGGRLAIRGLGNVRRTFVVDANGGPSRQVATDLASSGDPVWSPDGKWLLVHGRKAMSGPESGANWWLVPVGGTASRPTNVYETLATAQIESANLDVQPYPEDWSPNGVLFTATPRDAETRSVWRVGIDTQTGRVSGQPVTLTMGTTYDQSPASGSTGPVVFAALRRDRLILGLPLDANAGRPSGAVRVLRSDVGEITRATASDDGNVIAFHRFSGDAASVWIRDLRSNRERQIATTRRTPLNPVISGDGRLVGYTVATTDTGGQSGMGAVFVVAVEGGIARQVCEDCLLTQWPRGNHSVLAQFDRPASFGLIDIASGTRTDLLTGTDGPGASGFGRPLVSPDERRVAFGYRGRTYVAPFSGPHHIDTREWQPLLETHSGERICGWSPDSRLLYYLLERDGYRCLYALRLDARGTPVGDVFAVHHVHEGSREWGSTGFSSAVVNGLFLYNQVGTAGNIWLMR